MWQIQKKQYFDLGNAGFNNATISTHLFVSVGNFWFEGNIGWPYLVASYLLCLLLALHQIDPHHATIDGHTLLTHIFVSL